MGHTVGEILISQERVAARVRQLAETVARAYAGRNPVVVAVMKGCVLFLADLVRAWPASVDLEFVSAESYDGTQPGRICLTFPQDLQRRVAGRPVLVVDDIYDTGRTLTEVCRAVAAMGAAEVRTLVLLLKRHDPAAQPGCPSPTGAPPPLGTPDWVGFEIPDLFVVGYGLDYRGRYRNLPHVAVLRTEKTTDNS